MKHGLKGTQYNKMLTFQFTSKETLPVLCSFVQHASGWSTKEV